MRLALGNGAVQVVDAVDRDLVGNFFLLRFQLVQAHPCHLGLGERRPGNHAVVGLELLERVKQRIHRRIPRLVRCHMGELVGPSHIASGIDVGEIGLQKGVHLDRAVGGHAQLLQAKAVQVGAPADRNQQRVKGDAHRAASVLRQQGFFAAVQHFDAGGLVVEPQVNAFGRKAFGHQRGCIGVFARQQAPALLDLRHAAAQAGKGLCQFAANRPAAQHQQAPGAFAQRPDGFRREVVHLLQPGNRWNERPPARGNGDAARGQCFQVPVVVRDLHFPRRGDARRAAGHVHA